MIIKPEHIHEFALRDVCRCPLRRPDPCGLTASPLEIAVERTLRENLFLAFADEFLSRKHIRDRLDRAVQDAGEKNPDWQRMAAIAERLDQITMRYRVLSPATHRFAVCRRVSKWVYGNCVLDGSSSPQEITSESISAIACTEGKVFRTRGRARRQDDGNGV